MTTYATQMLLLMMLAFTLGSLISLLAARVLLPRLKDLQAQSVRPAAGDVMPQQHAESGIVYNQQQSHACARPPGASWRLS